MKKSIAAMGLLGIALANPVFANEGPVPQGIPHLNHVFVIMMENTAYGQIMNNPYAPFINQMAQSANLATNYFAIGHPSLTNYLEVVGGSNFGVRTDAASDWHDTSCTPNLASGITNVDNLPSDPTGYAIGKICPIAGTGTDAATPATDDFNEICTAAYCNPVVTEVNDIDGIQSIPAAQDISGKTIADQLFKAHLSWKSYQQSQPAQGADGVTYSDGFFTTKTDFTKLSNANVTNTSAGLVDLYAGKHNPFVYFRSVQEGTDPGLSLADSVGFDGAKGLYANLATGKVPAFSFIAPNQCNDQHGRGNGGPFCAYNPVADGQQDGLNPALIERGDITVKKLVTAIKASPAWKKGKNAIVVLWDENDYSGVPNVNRVVTIVDTNYDHGRVKSNKYYNHFSLLKSLESAFGLPCLNHACDKNVQVMSDLFGAKQADSEDGEHDKGWSSHFPLR